MPAFFPDQLINRRHIYSCLALSSLVGINRPMMTFSLRPKSLSILPLAAALVKTLEVFWKEAADNQDSVCREDRVMPKITSRTVAAAPFLVLARVFSSSNLVFSTNSPINS